MDFALAVRYIWRHKVWLIPIVIVAIIAALAVAYRVSTSPLGLKSRSLEEGAATVSILVDSKGPPLSAPVDVLSQRAVINAQLLKSQPVREMISTSTGIPPRDISIDGQTQTGDQGATLESNQPRQVQRAAELTSESASNRVYFTVNSGSPIINLYTQAQTARGATSLAQAAVDSLKAYTTQLQAGFGVSPSDRAELLQLGPPQGGVIASGATVLVAALIAAAVLFAGCLLILFVPRIAAEVRNVDESEFDSLPTDGHSGLRGSNDTPAQRAGHREATPTR